MSYYMNWLTYEFWTRPGGWEFDRSHGADTSSPSHWQQVEEQAPKPVGWMMCFLLMTFVPVQKLCVNIYIHSLYQFCYRTYIYIHQECHSVLVKLQPITFYRTVFLGSARLLGWMPLFVFFGLPIVSCSLINSLLRGCSWLLVFVLNNTLILGICCSAISHLPGCFATGPSFRISDGAIGPLYVTSTYSTWIFFRGVSGFATDCPCGVWCRGLTTCILHVGPPFGNRLLNKKLVCRLDSMDNISSFFGRYVFWHMQLYMSWYIISFFRFYLYFLNIVLYFFKYSCTNIFHRRCLYTFYTDSTNTTQYTIYSERIGRRSTCIHQKRN